MDPSSFVSHGKMAMLDGYGTALKILSMKEGVESRRWIATKLSPLSIPLPSFRKA